MARQILKRPDRSVQHREPEPAHVHAVMLVDAPLRCNVKTQHGAEPVVIQRLVSGVVENPALRKRTMPCLKRSCLEAAVAIHIPSWHDRVGQIAHS